MDGLVCSLSGFKEQTYFVFKFPSSTVLKWKYPNVQFRGARLSQQQRVAGVKTLKRRHPFQI
jgi:hypothetical protein